MMSKRLSNAMILPLNNNIMPIHLYEYTNKHQIGHPTPSLA